MPPTYPPHRPVLASEARAADRRAVSECGVPSIVLMEHAGRGIAEVVARRRASRGHVAVLCGPGNNGGDGYACARFLVSFGVPVRVVRCAAGAPVSPDAALEHALLARETEIRLAATLEDASAIEEALDGAAVVVDALFGTGGRPLGRPYVDWVERVNRADALRVAADIPSGLDADHGTPRPVAVRAHVTAAMGFVKHACTTPAGRPYAGELLEIDVGLPASVHSPYLL